MEVDIMIFLLIILLVSTCILYYGTSMVEATGYIQSLHLRTKVHHLGYNAIQIITMALQHPIALLNFDDIQTYNARTEKTVTLLRG